MSTTTLDTKVHDFLSQKRIAVAGVSRHTGDHPVGNLIYERLKKTGHQVFAVNPHMQTFEGDRCYPDLKSIPGGSAYLLDAGGAHCVRAPHSRPTSCSSPTSQRSVRKVME